MVRERIMIKAINHVWKHYRSIAMNGAIVFLVMMGIASTVSLAISPGITVPSGQPDVFIDLDNDGVWDEDKEPSFNGPDAIQRAIIAAHDGNTIRVNKNETTDYSRIIIYKAVRIVGNASNKPIIDGSLCKTSNMVAVHVKSSDVILDNFIIHDSSIGVLVHRLFGLPISNITISNCTIYDIKGIFGWTPPAYCPKGCAIALVGDVTSSIIRNNVIYDCEKGIFLSGGADNNSIISNEVYDADIGILLNTARDNIIMWNSIHHNEIGIKIFKNNTIHCNDIFENEKYGIKVPSCPLAEPVDAKYNWWGSSSGPYDDHDTDSAPPPYNNMEGTGDRVTAYVYYRPWERIVTNISFDGPVSTENGYPLIGGSTKINLAAATTCPCCWIVNATYYRVWYSGSWDPTPGSGVDDTGNFKLYTGNFTLSGDGLHYLEFYSEDSGGHKEGVKNVTVYVDDTPPQIIKTVGYPHVQGDGYPDYWITSSTNITINATEQGYSNSDLEKVSYRIYCNGTWSSWTDITTELPYTLKFSEECNHTLQIVAKDCLGNTAWDNETFYVDNTPPDVSIEFGTPLCDQGNKTFITSYTPIWVNATDNGTEPCIVGSVNLTVDVYNAT
ncbi:MAG TPA: hypothetical protein ENL44_02985, partial [Thermoplasmatales archaeon]|nr:hypothetical protein [Thermoplasmatales archaeon]